MKYTDAFSSQANLYTKFRFQYPNELYESLYSHRTHFNQAWDVGTGDGQAALALSQKFKKIIASDLSEKQISQATKKFNITYISSPTEEMKMNPGTLDLITIA